MNEKKVEQKEDGVEVMLPEKIGINEAKEVVSSCASGTSACCSSDCSDFLSDKKIGAFEKNGKAVIKITGNATKEEVEEKLKSCSCL
ncbi:hypothetical protein Mia14_0900 [Candidatus Mancarchaeum acidiphilum]|uniref:Uncharacterized protein n=1 Tax=Candidatus Mancarchaeum acidiphilum TaxID=1920749 RepID=A0A218NNX5_9ARCH|nr:hypothetical protein [Candidatus Mancarchaeum acidiphilum]ASI14179.1 hypothetical protein Mia14_0900 [Candidatus Mancarchaeum acidiphilum]